jgi:hypothetical protein
MYPLFGPLLNSVSYHIQHDTNSIVFQDLYPFKH